MTRYRSINVTRTTYVLNGMAVNLDFIITPTFLPNSTTPLWTDFHQQVPWNTILEPPRNLRRLYLFDQGHFVYRRCPPFFLEADPCSSWLEWTIVPYPVINEPPIKTLRIKSGRNPASIRNSTLICTKINYDLYVKQLLLLSHPITSNQPTTPANHEEIRCNPCKIS